MLYFDHNATSPIRPEVLDCLIEAAREDFANPSSAHRPGRRARARLEAAREALAGALGGRALEYAFTSGGTEANRLAIEGALRTARSKGRARPHVVAGAVEHPSVLSVYEDLAARGEIDLTVCPAGPDGRVDVRAIEGALSATTALVSVQHANNETGAIQPLAEVAALCRRHGAVLHADAVQSLGKVPLDIPSSGADLVTLSAHKIGGPRGAGALWIRSGAAWEPPWKGGPQEQGRRPGTENLPAIAGFVRAVELVLKSRPAGFDLGGVLWEAVRARVPDAVLNGGPEGLLPNTRNISFPGVEAEDLLMRLDLEGVAASMGSACASGSREPSRVLRAMGLPEDRVRSALRFSCGWTTQEADVEELARLLERIVPQLRAGG